MSNQSYQCRDDFTRTLFLNHVNEPEYWGFDASFFSTSLTLYCHLPYGSIYICLLIMAYENFFGNLGLTSFVFQSRT